MIYLLSTVKLLEMELHYLLQGSQYCWWFFPHCSTFAATFFYCSYGSHSNC